MKLLKKLDRRPVTNCFRVYMEGNYMKGFEGIK